MQIKTCNGNKRTVYPCKNGCGKYCSRKNIRCIECYKKERKANVNSNPNAFNRKHKGVTNQKDHRKLYPCKNNCGKMIRKRGGICINCYNKALHRLGERKQVENDKRKADTQARQEKYIATVKIDICPKSPNQRHWEVINADKIGICKYCGREKDYKKLQEKYVNFIAGGRKEEIKNGI